MGAKLRLKKVYKIKTGHWREWEKLRNHYCLRFEKKKNSNRRVFTCEIKKEKEKETLTKDYKVPGEIF